MGNLPSRKEWSMEDDKVEVEVDVELLLLLDVELDDVLDVGKGRRRLLSLTAFLRPEGLKYRLLNFFLTCAISLKKLTNITGLRGKLSRE